MKLFAALALTMVAFAANSLLNRMALSTADTGPLAFAALRVLSGAIVLSVLVLVQGNAARLKQALSVPKAAALSLYMLGFSLAYLSLDAGIGALILFGGVQLTMFAGAMIGGERLTFARTLGAGIAFAGLAWLLWPAGPVILPVAGTAAMLAAALGWGLYSLMGRGNSDPMGTTAAAFVLAAVPVGAAAVVLWDGMSPSGAALALLSGSVTSGLGYALWYRLLPQLAAVTAAVAQLTVAPIAIAMGAALLGEWPDPGFLLAALVILAGVFLAVLPQRKTA